MAQLIYSFTAVIPAGTPVNSPAEIDVSFPPGIVSEIDIRVPPGPAGLVGFAIQNSGVTVIPYASDPFIITADEIIHWPLTGQISSGSWQVSGYNTDTNDHAIYVRFQVDPPPPPDAPSTPAMIDDDVLNAVAVGLSSTGTGEA